MKKKIMAFLLAATMVVGCATTASAAGTTALTIKAVKDNKSEATDSTFTVNKAWNFISDTDVNSFAAAWSNQKDDTSKGLIAAWRNGFTQSELTARQYNWSTQYAFGGTDIIHGIDSNEKTINNGYNQGMYGDWYTKTWNKEVSFQDNTKDFADPAVVMGTTDGKNDYNNSIVYTYANYIKTTANLFANVGNKKYKMYDKVAGADSAEITETAYEIKSGYAVILRNTVDRIEAQYKSTNATDNQKADAAFANSGAGYLTTGTVTPTELRDAVAFVFNAPTKLSELDANYDAVKIAALRTGVIGTDYVFFAEKASTDKKFDALVAGLDGGKKVVYKYDQVSPFEALELKNVTNYYNNNLYVGYNMAQANDLYEVMSNKKSIYDGNLDGKFFDGNGLPSNDSQVRIWRWKDIYSRDLWTQRNALWAEAEKAVKAAWYDGIREDVIKAYNAANGEQTLNADAKIGDIMYYDIVKTSGTTPNKYTLIVGGTAKEVTDQAKAVVALHWNGKSWDKVNAEMQRVNFNVDKDSWGVLLEANSYSPYIIIEVTDEGTSVDATAEAAKTPEKSGKTGVSFLGL